LRWLLVIASATCGREHRPASCWRHFWSDLLRFAIRNPHRDSSVVADVMKNDPVTVRPETSLSVAIAAMLTRRINCLPVVDAEARLVGILTSTDLLHDFQKIQERIEGVDSSEL
jgi:CBS-domain-containing membrane protein